MDYNINNYPHSIQNDLYNLYRLQYANQNFGNYAIQNNYPTVQTPSFRGSLEIPPDTFTPSTQLQPKKEGMSIFAKWGLGALTIAGITFCAIKLGKVQSQKKAIQEIEKKFTDLQNDMPKVQKTFKEVFLRDDLTEKEVQEMLNRYKEIEKLGVTGTKEEYAKKIFEEAKSNYGLGNTKICMEYDVLHNKGGAYAPGFCEVEISSSNPKERLMNVIHHELRHVKQTYFAINAEPQKYIDAMKEAKKGTDFEKNIPSIKEVLEPFNQEIPNKKLVPEKYKSFVDDVIKGAKEHTYSSNESGEIYKNNLHEIDARFAGESIAKLFGLIAK